MSTESNEADICPFIDPSEAEAFQKHKYPTYYWWVVLHELLGHGTGKMMIQDGEDQFNFDISAPPINPLTGNPISKWYQPGQTWTGQFGDLATTVDECRAELVGAYLMDNKDLLELFGFHDKSEITAEDSKLLFRTIIAAILIGGQLPTTSICNWVLTVSAVWQTSTSITM